MKALLLTAFLSGSVLSWAQNLIPNSDFESHNALPFSSGQWYMANDWTSVNTGLDASAPSPDYLHTGGSNEVQLPLSSYALLTPHSGNGVMGFVAYSGSAVDFREYVSTTLTEAMVPGEVYKVSFWITNGGGTHAGGSQCENVGVHLSNSSLEQTSYFPITSVTPQFVVPGSSWSTDWQFISFQITATEAWSQFTIGNFNDDGNTVHSVADPAALFPTTAYYFIDDVAIEKVVALIPLAIQGDNNLCSGESTHLTAVGSGPYTWADSESPAMILSTDSSLITIPDETTTYQLMSPVDTAWVTIVVQSCASEMPAVTVLEMPNVFTPDGDGINDRFVPVEMSGYNGAYLTIVDRWGGRVFSTEQLSSGWDGTVNGEPCSEGVYFWTIAATAKDGTRIEKQGFVNVFR